MEWYEPLEIADGSGRGTGRYRLTRRADDPPSNPYGLCDHEHTTPEEARSCPEARARLPEDMR